MKKKIILITLCAALCFLFGCSNPEPQTQIVATTLPVYEFTSYLCEGTGLSVTQLVNEQVSCLHDYTLQVSQMRTVEASQVLVMSGAGLENFLSDVIGSKDNVIDASEGIELACSEHSHDHGHKHGHTHEHEGKHEHEHELSHEHGYDAHIWLSPKNAMVMAQNICHGLSHHYPEHEAAFENNLTSLLAKLEQLQSYGETTLKDLSCRDLVTFHDGFHYLAESFDLHILKAIEEEAGSETSASVLIELIELVEKENLPAIFTECNGSTASANVISSETGCPVYSLNMAMSGVSYFDAMYHNIDTIKEALG